MKYNKGYDYKQFYNDMGTVSWGKVFRTFIDGNYASIFVIDSYYKVGVINYFEHEVIHGVFGNDIIKFWNDGFGNMKVARYGIYIDLLIEELWRKLKLEELNIKTGKHYILKIRTSDYYDYIYLYDEDTKEYVIDDRNGKRIIDGIQNLIDGNPVDNKIDDDNKNISRINLEIARKIVDNWW